MTVAEQAATGWRLSGFVTVEALTWKASPTDADIFPQNVSAASPLRLSISSIHSANRRSLDWTAEKTNHRHPFWPDHRTPALWPIEADGFDS